MVSVIEWLMKNVEWVFSGIGLIILSGIWRWLRSTPAGSEPTNASLSNHQSVVVQVTPRTSLPKHPEIKNTKQKSAVSILFIDDDVKFQVVNILKRNGWINTKIIKDVVSLEQAEVAAADIYFVDIQGVGVNLRFKDQGLGLVIALRKKYPTKKIVIYSAENANAFHAAFGQADERISKDADPYEFMEAVDRLSE